MSVQHRNIHTYAYVNNFEQHKKQDKTWLYQSGNLGLLLKSHHTNKMWPFYAFCVTCMFFGRSPMFG